MALQRAQVKSKRKANTSKVISDSKDKVIAISVQAALRHLRAKPIEFINSLDSENLIKLLWRVSPAMERGLILCRQSYDNPTNCDKLGFALGLMGKFHLWSEAQSKKKKPGRQPGQTDPKIDRIMAVALTSAAMDKINGKTPSKSEYARKVISEGVSLQTFRRRLERMKSRDPEWAVWSILGDKW